MGIQRYRAKTIGLSEEAYPAHLVYDDEGEAVMHDDHVAHTAALVRELTKFADWLEWQAAKNDEDVKTCRFESLNEAYRADAKNYRAMAKHARAALDGQP